MRVKNLDAWAWGLPIVSTTIGAEGARYEDGKNLLIGDNVDDFAAAVTHLLCDPDFAARVADAGRQTAETTYEWRKVYQAWDEVYD
jgi:glycosyltransferase involved in cell wall biosynthesis